MVSIGFEKIEKLIKQAKEIQQTMLPSFPVCIVREGSGGGYSVDSVEKPLKTWDEVKAYCRGVASGRSYYIIFDDIPRPDPVPDLVAASPSELLFERDVGLWQDSE